MHFYMFNPSDFNNSARHLSLVERAIYRDLIDMYYHNEQAIDTSDMDALARRLLCTTPEYRTSLEYVLSEFFVKRGKRHHHHRIDKEIKAYKYKNKNGNASNASSNVTRNGVTFDVTQGVTPSNDECNVTCNDNDIPMTPAERVRKSRQERKLMIECLKGVGVTVDKGIKIADLRSLYVEHSDSISAKAVKDGAEIVTQGVTPSNDDCNASNAKNAAITSNYEPLTNNQKPVLEDARTHEENSVVGNSVDNFNAVDSSTDDNQASPAESTISQPTVSQPTKAELIRSQHADSIENWEAPTIDQMRGELFKAGKMIQLTDDQYQFEVSAFKAHYAEQALKGNPLTTESYRKVKLVKWMIREANNQKADQARQEKAKGRFNIDNEDWSGTTSSQSNRDSDMPDIYHPSHSVPAAGKIDHSKGCVFNGLFKEPLPNMTIAETYDYVKQNRMPGKASDETYDALLVNLQEAV